MFVTTFSVTEAALVRTYAVPYKAQGAFRGKLGNLQKQGLFGAKNMPGRGKALRGRAQPLADDDRRRKHAERQWRER